MGQPDVLVGLDEQWWRNEPGLYILAAKPRGGSEFVFRELLYLVGFCRSVGECRDRLVECATVGRGRYSPESFRMRFANHTFVPVALGSAMDIHGRQTGDGSLG